VAGDERQVRLGYPELIKYIKPGERLVLGDGLPELRVTRVTRSRIEAKVSAAGDVRSQQGFNAPETHLPVSAVTEKDLDDLALGIKLDVDWVAMSFVRGPEDLEPLRDLMRRKRKPIPVISKIERHEAIRNLEAIIAASDGIMVARGDLGVELPVDRVPVLQKTIIRACNAAGKPVITATQMLESMMQNRRPTRAEVTDIANAILDGTDAVMLSGETAAGKYPVQAVRMMARVALRAETAIDFEAMRRRRLEAPARTATDAISEAACAIADDLKARVIISSTSSGYTARMVSKNRPKTPIVGATDQVTTYRRLALVWGVNPVVTDTYTDTDEMLRRVLAEAKRERWVKEGDVVVITAGVPVGLTGHTNLIKVATVEW
jgi:pyruvate kinase